MTESMHAGRRRLWGALRVFTALAILASIVAIVAPGDAPSTADAAAAGQASRYVAISPSRVLDTRDPGFTIMRDSDTLSVDPLTPAVLAAAGVDPLSVEAVVINLAMTRTVAGAWLRSLPTALTTPNDVETAAVNNQAANVDVTNMSIVPVGANGLISIYALRSTHVVIDVQGVFTRATSSQDGRFVPLPVPTRAIDTRLTQPPVAAQTSLEVDLTSAGIPPTASAAVINIVATETQGGGYLTAYPGGREPLASNLNYSRPGEDIAAGAITRLDNGKLRIFTSTTTHIVVDVIGYMTGPSADPSSSGLFVAVPPERHYDSRSSEFPFGNSPLAAGTSRALQIAGKKSIPATGVLGIASNLTMTETAGGGYLVMYPSDPVPANYASVNSVFANQTVGNHAIAALGDGKVRVFARVSSEFIVDITGYFLDGTTTPPSSPPRTATNPAPDRYAPGFVPIPPVDDDYEYLIEANQNPSLGAYSRDGRRYYGWNPCEPITYAVNTERATQPQIDAMNRAIRNAEDASGFDFQYVGEVTGSLKTDSVDPRVPVPLPSGPAAAMTVIGFSDPYGTPIFRGGTIGIGGIGPNVSGSPITLTAGDTFAWIVRGGFALIDISDIIDPAQIESAFTHEIAHMLGIDHVNSIGELMRPVISNPPQTSFGNGDKNGLYSIGAPQCSTKAPLATNAPLAKPLGIDVSYASE